MPRSYPPEFRRKVLDLLKAGRTVAQVAADLQISDQTIYVWRRQDLIDSGQLPGLSSTDNAELVAARRRIVQLETELAVTRRANELLKEAVPPKQVPGHRGDGPRRAADPDRLPGRGRGGVGLLRLAVPAAVNQVDPACLA